MTALYAAIVTLIVTLVVVLIAVIVARSTSAATDSAAATSFIYRIRSIYFLLILGVAVVALALTLPMTPYPARFAAQKPQAVVKVTGEMWFWTLAPGPGGAMVGGRLVLPSGKLVEFDVTSKDVNHGFGIYTAAGKLLGQVQAMPNYENRLFYTFYEPGRYYILCLEYCGLAHHAMNVDFDVK